MKLMTDEQLNEFLRIRDEKDSNIKAAKYIASLNLTEEEKDNLWNQKSGKSRIKK